MPQVNFEFGLSYLLSLTLRAIFITVVLLFGLVFLLMYILGYALGKKSDIKNVREAWKKLIDYLREQHAFRIILIEHIANLIKNIIKLFFGIFTGKFIFIPVAAFLLVVFILYTNSMPCNAASELCSTPTPTPTPAVTSTPTPEPTPTLTPTAIPSHTPPQVPTIVRTHLFNLPVAGYYETRAYCTSITQQFNVHIENDRDIVGLQIDNHSIAIAGWISNQGVIVIRVPLDKITTQPPSEEAGEICYVRVKSTYFASDSNPHWNTIVGDLKDFS